VPAAPAAAVPAGFAAYPDDVAIEAAAAEVAALKDRFDRAAGAVKAQLAEADQEIAALTARLGAAGQEIAAANQTIAALTARIADLQAEQAAERARAAQALGTAQAAGAAETARADEWRRLLYLSERMLVDAIDRITLRVLAKTKPRPHADAAAPAVSIVMPVYNQADLVATAIRSVLAQTFAGWELIVVDDGSTDGLEAALRPFLADPRIRLVRQANAGECAARNHGLRFARGEIVAYLDSDNFWYPDFLAAAVEVFRADPDLEIAYGGSAYDWPNGDVRFYLLPFDRQKLLADNLADVNVIMHRRSAYERYGGFDESLTHAVEWDLMLRYTAERPAAHIPVLGARYRIVRKDRLPRHHADSVFRVRRKLWNRPAPAPRVLFAAAEFPQLSASLLNTEIACMRRFGAAVQVWAPAAGAAPVAHDITLHRGALADAIGAFRPDAVHVHGCGLLAAQRGPLAGAAVPVTVRGDSGDVLPEALAAAAGLPNLRFAYLQPGPDHGPPPAGVAVRYIAPPFDTTLFAPPKRKDRRLVLGMGEGRPECGLRFLFDLARLLPEHRVVVAVARVSAHEGEIEALAAYRADTGSPAELLVDVPRAEIARLAGEAAIYVHTAATADALRRRAGMAISSVEAWAMGALVLAPDTPAFAYIGDDGARYAGLDDAAARIRETETWSEAQWRRALVRAVERAFNHHADELLLRPMFEDWCAIARERAQAEAA
jgi:hypothetical protein